MPLPPSMLKLDPVSALSSANVTYTAQVAHWYSIVNYRPVEGEETREKDVRREAAEWNCRAKMCALPAV